MTSLRGIALAAIAAHVLPEADFDGPPELAFLSRQLAAVSGPGGWVAAARAALGSPDKRDEPLVALADDLGLDAIEVLSVALAAAVEEDAIVGRALACVQAPLGGSRPTLSLLAMAFEELTPMDEHPVHALVGGAAIASGLLALEGEALPLPERAVSLPPHLVLALAGRDGSPPGASLALGACVPLPPSLREAAARHAAALAGGQGRTLVIRTGSPAEGRAVAAEVAAALGMRPLLIAGDPPAGLGPYLLLRGLVPVFVREPAPGDRAQLPAVPGYGGPALAIAGPDGTVEPAGGAALGWALPVPPREERRALWLAALGDAALADELSGHHRHRVGRIAHMVAAARHHAAVAGEPWPSPAALSAAAWSDEGAALDSLAVPIAADVPDEALVLPGGLRGDLGLLLLHCRARDGLADGLGVALAARYQPGVRALFVGPSGTGKTLAASWLAARLGMPLYRVDLAGVTSKYIGETEKNLARLLARAEQAEVILLFDEADSLFGKRTDVREANDRFANAQTNYLLQRIESYDGIAILTSNSRSRFDDAFTRRLDMVLEFPLPGPEERRDLWLAHLGSGHSVGPGQLNQIAAAADLGGGHIRNAVVAAAVLASDSRRPIGYDDVVRGLASEYRKLGRQLPPELHTRQP